MSIVSLLHDKLRNQPQSSLSLTRYGKAIAQTRHRIEQPHPETDETLLATTGALAEHHRVQGRQEEHDIHWKNLAKLIEARGGLQSLRSGSVARCLLGVFDSIQKISTAQSSFQHQRFISPPKYPDQYHAELPLGFQKLLAERKLSVKVLELVSRTFRLQKGGCLDQELHNRHHRKYNDFLEACPCLGWDEGLERLICLAIMTYCALSSRPIPRSTFVAPRKILATSLRLHEASSRAEQHCVLWMYFIAMTAWKEQSEEAALLHECIRRFPETNTDWSTIEDVLRSFFWTSGLSKAWFDRRARLLCSFNVTFA